MSASDSNGRLSCPGCNARLAIPDHNRSPYIRCGVCNVLFQTEVEPSEISEVRVAHASGKTKHNIGDYPQYGNVDSERSNRGNPSVSEQRVAARPHRPSPEFDWSRPEGRRGRSCWSTGGLAIAAMLFFGCLIISLISWVDSSGPQSIRRSVTHRMGHTSGRDSIENKLDAWSRGGYPKHELDLSAPGQINKIRQGLDSIIIDDRKLTTKELARLKKTDSLRKVKYSNVFLTDIDLQWVENKNLFELDLSHSKWQPSRLKISRVNFPYLVNLDLSYSTASDETIWRLHHCRYLDRVNLRNTRVTDQSVRFLLLHHELSELDVCRTQVTGAGLVSLRNPGLSVLKVSPGVLDSTQRRLIRKNNPQLRIIVAA